MPSDLPPARLFAGAQQAHRAGRLEQAEQLYRAVLAQVPDHADALHLLGLLRSQQGNHADAARCIQQALALAPRRPDFHNNLGEVQRRQGATEGALASYRQALHLAPDFAEAHYNLANVLKQQGHLGEAIGHYQHAVRLNPKHIQAYYNLGNTLLEQGDYHPAIAAYRQASALNPAIAEVHLNLGNALNGAYRIEEALASYRRAAQLKPTFTEAYHNAGQILLRQGKMDAARQMYKRVLEAEPDNDLFRLLVETLCPLVPVSTDEIDQCRANVQAMLKRYREHPPRIDLHRLHIADGRPPYMLMYHGRDDRAIKEQWAALFTDRLPLAQRMPRQGLPHVGFVVAKGHEDVFARCMAGFLNHLPRDTFRLTVVCNREGGARKIQPLLTCDDVRFLALPSQFDQALPLVEQAGFDLLLYWEVGSDVNNYFLPFCRPAPVQCATWGNPVTTGIPAIDYFVSSDLLETDTSEQYYSETLIRLKTLPTCFARPAEPNPFRSRAQFGLPETQTIYHSAQNMRKIHPHVDALFAEILRRDPNGMLLLIEDNQENITYLMRQRFQQSMPDVAHRVHFFQHLTSEGYRNLTAVADVVLDTPHYGLSAHTLYDAFANGVPVVTMPGPFLRSRYAYGAYQQMDVTECITASEEEYVAQAVRLGTDAAYRAEVSARIASASPVLFDDMNAVHELANFFDYALETVRNQ
jgi:predicted O-linked N-acetylglucosamine transferase (SPINDLY family)